MKEENKDIGKLVSRYGLLTILGLGATFLGTSSMYGVVALFDATNIEKDVQLEAIGTKAASTENVWEFDDEGKLQNWNNGAKAGDGNVFRNGQEDFLHLKGKADENLVRVIFKKDNEPGAGFVPTVKIETLLAVKALIDTGGGLNDVFAAAKDDSLSAVLHRAAAAEVVNEIRAIKNVTELAGTQTDAIVNGTTIANVPGAVAAGANTTVTKEDFIKVLDLFTTLLVKNKNADFKTQADLMTLIGAIVADGDKQVDGTAASTAAGSAPKAVAIATDIAAILAARITGTPTHKANELTAKATDIDAFATTTLADLMTNAPWNTPDGGTFALLQGSGTGILEILEDIQKKYDEALALLGDTTKTSLTTLQTATGKDTVTDFDKVLEKQINDYAAAITAIEGHVDDKMRALVMITPPAAAAGATAPRSYSVQISAQDLANKLDLDNAAASGIAFYINNTVSPVEGDAVNLLFENTSSAIPADYRGPQDDVNVGTILYKNLAADQTLRLMNNILSQKNEAMGTITVKGIKSLDNETGEHLTLQLFRAPGMGRHKNQPHDFIFTDAIAVKKLLLGINEENALSIKLVNEKGVLVSQELKKANVAVKFEHDLTVGGIDVLGNSVLAFQNNQTLKLGGDVNLANGNATLRIGIGAPNAGDIFTIIPTLGQGKLPKINLIHGDTIVFTSDTLLALVPVSVSAPTEHTYVVISLNSTKEDGPAVLTSVGNVTLTLASIDLGATKVNGETLGADVHPAMVQIGDKSFARIENITIRTMNNEKSPDILSVGEGATLTLGNATVLGATGVDNITMIRASNNVTIVVDGGTTLYGDVNAGKGLAFSFAMDDEGAIDTITWPKGNLVLPAEEKAAINLGGDSLSSLGLNNLKKLLAKWKEDELVLFDLTNNATLKAANLLNLIATDLSLPKVKGVQIKINGDNVIIDFDNATVPNNLAELLALNSGEFNRTYLSDDFYQKLERIVMDGAGSKLEGSLLNIINNNTDFNNSAKSKTLSVFCKTTTEEKNRATLTLINSAREIAYSKMGQQPLDDKHYSVWASGFGDIARNGCSDSYKMKCDIYGFTVGIDTSISDNFLIGVLAGYGKVNAKYRGDMLAGASQKCNVKSYFGGIYGLWEEFVTDVCIKFSLLTGSGKYDENILLPIIAEAGADVDHKGHWIAGNIDCTYKHWDVYGINFGPWVSLSMATVHQKASQTAIKEEEDYFVRSVDAADRRSVDASIGIAADYDFAVGNFECAMGYKREFRRLQDGQVTLSYRDDDGNIVSEKENDIGEYMRFDASNINTGKNSFVARASWNMQFGNFGLTLGGHGQIGNHFRDIAGSITASYSF
jgi:hypothetical protein